MKAEQRSDDAPEKEAPKKMTTYQIRAYYMAPRSENWHDGERIIERSAMVEAESEGQALLRAVHGGEVPLSFIWEGREPRPVLWTKELEERSSLTLMIEGDTLTWYDKDNGTSIVIEARKKRPSTH